MRAKQVSSRTGPRTPLTLNPARPASERVRAAVFRTTWWQDHAPLLCPEPRGRSPRDPSPCYLEALQAVLEGLQRAAELLHDVARVPRQVAHGVLARGRPARRLAPRKPLAAPQLGRELANGLALRAQRLLLLHDGLTQLQHRGPQLLLGAQRAALHGHRGQWAAGARRLRGQSSAHEAVAGRQAVLGPGSHGERHASGQQRQHPAAAALTPASAGGRAG